MQPLFTTLLLEWHYRSNKRQMPWKHQTNPYTIWLSEIILQQTRTEQAIPYYQKLLAHYPTVHHLATAPKDEVFKLWQGLGYYRRCENMLIAAQQIVATHKGIFPTTYKELLTLKGIGSYTAAAIASFAYNLPHAVVDGNVIRILARYFGIDTPYDTTAGKKHIEALALSLLPPTESARYNQAIMDFGATVCKPKGALCTTCPLSDNCMAYKAGRVHLLPAKSKFMVHKTRYFNYFIIIYNHKIWLRQRSGADIWQHLYEPYLIETPGGTAGELYQQPAFTALNIAIEALQPLNLPTKQALTHQIIHCNYFMIDSLTVLPPALASGIWVLPQELGSYAFPQKVGESLVQIVNNLV